MTNEESQGFWRDIIDWYNDPFEGTHNQGGPGEGKAHPRGCRGCSDNKLSWWCPLYFTVFVLWVFLELCIEIPKQCIIFVITSRRK
jgi:hypothetical protein